MQNQTFTLTKELIKRNGVNLSQILSENLAQHKFNWNKNNSTGAWNTKQSLEHMYLMNNFLIGKIENLQELLHAGLFNQTSQYSESDLHLIKTILKVSVFNLQSKPEFSQPLNYSFEELKLKLSFQTVKFLKLTKETPVEYVSNYKNELSIIPGITLDVYQMIYFAFEHMQHHLKIIEIQHNVNAALNNSQLITSPQLAL